MSTCLRRSRSENRPTTTPAGAVCAVPQGPGASGRLPRGDAGAGVRRARRLRRAPAEGFEPPNAASARSQADDACELTFSQSRRSLAGPWAGGKGFSLEKFDEFTEEASKYLSRIPFLKRTVLGASMSCQRDRRGRGCPSRFVRRVVAATPWAAFDAASCRAPRRDHQGRGTVRVSQELVAR